jgi:hypothetical protein
MPSPYGLLADPGVLLTLVLVALLLAGLLLDR